LHAGASLHSSCRVVVLFPNKNKPNAIKLLPACARQPSIIGHANKRNSAKVSSWHLWKENGAVLSENEIGTSALQLIFQLSMEFGYRINAGLVYSCTMKFPHQKIYM